MVISGLWLQLRDGRRTHAFDDDPQDHWHGLQAYIQDRIARPLQWGVWGWGYRRKELTHTPGGGGIAVRAPNMIRFGELLMNEGRWRGQQIIPSDYVRSWRLSNYNPHSPYSLKSGVTEGLAAIRVLQAVAHALG